MRVLAIDSSGLTATVAIVEDDTTIAEFTINYKKTHSQTLLPMIDEMVKMVEADLNTIDAIAVREDRDRLQDFGSDLQQQKVWGLR